LEGHWIFHSYFQKVTSGGEVKGVGKVGTFDYNTQKRKMAKPKSFKGGYSFGNLIGSPKGKAIKVLPTPKRVIIPLNGATPTVKIGDQVRAGEVIGQADLLAPLLSSISGEVARIDDEAVLIESDGKDEWISFSKFENFKRSGPKELRGILYKAGVGVGDFKLQQGQEIKLLINAVETEPYLEGNNQLLEESLEEFVIGLEVLRGALGNIPVHVGINYKSKAYKRLGQDKNWLHIHPLLPKYPQDIPEVLIRTVFGKMVQVMVLDVQGVIAAYEAVVKGKPYIERVVSLGGPAVSEPGNFRVRIGTTIGELLEGRLNDGKIPFKVIRGGLLRGEAAYMDMPITKDCGGIAVVEDSTDKELFPFANPGVEVESYSRAFLSAFLGSKRQASTKLHGAQRECVRCGYCIEVCPVRIAPIFIARYSQHGMLKEAKELGVEQCIDCGLCSFVCPSKMPLTYQIKEGRRNLKRQ
jgi:Na+-translocating ferredoxin:NAD+ oxidoreductase RnfC subunit